MTGIVTAIRPGPLDCRADQVMVRMRDGVRLATDVYLPRTAGRAPAILVRLPYDKCGRYCYLPLMAPYFNERGYVFVTQDVRGKFRSEGETVPYVHDVVDAYDTLEWITRQRWSSGVVGMFGESIFGTTQWAALASGHTALRAIVPAMTTADMEAGHVLASDRDLGVLTAAMDLVTYWSDNFAYEFDEANWPAGAIDWGHRPLAEAFEPLIQAIGTRSQAFDMLLQPAERRGRPSPYPAGHPFDGRAIPVLHRVGWFDVLQPQSMVDYTTLCARADKRDMQYLWAGSTDHDGHAWTGAPVAPEHDHDTNDDALARWLPGWLAPVLDFCDATLRGHQSPENMPRVHWHLANEDWHTASSWPPRGAGDLLLYLGDGRRATQGPEGGSLLLKPPSERESVQWVHDPDNLVSSTTDDPWSILVNPQDERTVESRDDVVTFTCEPVDRPLDLAGPVSAFLTATSTGPSMPLIVKLVDVAPDGTANMLLRGESLTRSHDLGEPAAVYLGHIGFRLEAGHRLRVHIASSDFPLSTWYPGTDENPWWAVRTERNGQTLVIGGSEASHVRLTVLGDRR